jgi:ferritin
MPAGREGCTVPAAVAADAGAWRVGGSMSRFTDALDAHLVNEYSASQQYIAIAVWYDDQTLPQLARHFYRQAVEERNHAMIMVQYLLDTDEEVRIPDIKSQQTTYDDVAGPVKMALEQEKRVTDEINALFKIARESGDYKAEEFLMWFIKEQVEEVRSMNDLLNVVDQAKGNVLMIEDFMSREQIGDEGDDPTAPPAAGGAL